MSRRLYLTLLIIALLSFLSSAWADTASILLEEGIYAEETKGDLDEAISIYKKIIDENDGNLVSIAKAYYRLGTCYLKIGEDTKAKEIFKEILARFSEQEEIISEVKTQMAKLDITELGPEPWSDGETSWYNIKTAAGMDVGKNIWIIKNAVINGNDIWRIKNYLVLPADNLQRYSRVDVFKDNFLPISGIVKNSRSGKFEGAYEEDHVQLAIDSPTFKTSKEIPISGIVYDNEESVHLFRRLPIKEEYSTSLTFFVFNSGNKEKVKVSVKGMEKVTVPAGTFDCYRIEVDGNSGGKQKFWVSADDNKYMVKIESQIIAELEKVTQIPTREREIYDNSEFKLSMSAPRGWYFVKSPISAQYKMVLQVIPPEIKSYVLFLISPHGGIIKKETFRPLVEQEVNSLTGFFKNYTIRSSSWISGEIAGLPSLSVIADYDDNDKKMVEYRTYILGSSQIYAYVIRTEQENFDNSKNEFDSIIQSFNVDED